MKPITTLFLKTFLLTGIPYGLMMALFDYANQDRFNIWKCLTSSFFFGITMSIILVGFHKYRLKKNGVVELTDENLNVSQSREIKSELDKQAFLNKLTNDEMLGKMKITQNENEVILSSGITWRSWGESIKIRIMGIDLNKYVYQIRSEPKLKTTLIDYGKNLENINRIQSILENAA